MEKIFVGDAHRMVGNTPRLAETLVGIRIGVGLDVGGNVAGVGGGVSHPLCRFYRDHSE